jgi:hypothetical protein
MADVDAGSYTLITGKYETGTPEQKKVISDILGANQIEYKYKLYFHWYNVIHELGHAILRFNANDKLQDVEEEPLVNDFAVAYWSYYGENKRYQDLYEIVKKASTRYVCPVPAGMDYMLYARENWGKEDFFTFNNYGWFQFNCVLDSLNNQKPLHQCCKQ